MSICTSVTTQTSIENASDTQFNNSHKKSYNKMEFMHKVHIISAVEKGQTKVDIAREFGVHPRTVAYIYKQRDAIIKKYKQKFSININRSIDLSDTLLNWFRMKMNTDRTVTEEAMEAKAEEIARSLKHRKFKCTSEWMKTFKKNHKIIKHIFNDDTELTPKASIEWSRVMEGFDEDNIYIGGTCAILHSDTWQSYLSGTLNMEKQMSMMLLTNITGTDKKELLVVGKEIRPISIKTLPIEYYFKENSLIDHSIITNLLKEWDNELKILDKRILLGLMIPDTYLNGLEFEQIKFIKCSNCIYIPKTLEKVITCFKYHYRRLQIMQTFSFNRNEPELLDYIRLLSLAWHSVSSETLQHIFHPRINGCLYFQQAKCFVDNEENEGFKLSEWCSTHAIPLQFENNMLDKFMMCDKHVASLDEKQNGPGFSGQLNTFISEEGTHSPTSAIDAFQAMKRLVRYLQCEKATESTINSGKNLEDLLEYNACIEIQQNIANSLIDMDK